jgi:AcrR family transcriptional regulator
MVRQPRSEATRRKIINAAVELFSEVGYAATGLSDITERVDVTKGALYHHFESKESLARAIIEEGADRIARVCRPHLESSSPALDSMIHGVFAAGELATDDKLIRTAVHLLHTFAEVNEATRDYYRGWSAELAALVERAQEAGDIRLDLDPDVVGEFILSAMVGADLVSTTTSEGADLVQRLGRTWELLLPAIVTADSQPYFREFVARQSRRRQTSVPID